MAKGLPVVGIGDEPPGMVLGTKGLEESGSPVEFFPVHRAPSLQEHLFLVEAAGRLLSREAPRSRARQEAGDHHDGVRRHQDGQGDADG